MEFKQTEIRQRGKMEQSKTSASIALRGIVKPPASMSSIRDC